MDVQTMRRHVKGAYPGDKWANRVAKMNDSQIIAVFKRLQYQGKIKV